MSTSSWTPALDAAVRGWLLFYCCIVRCSLPPTTQKPPNQLHCGATSIQDVVLLSQSPSASSQGTPSASPSPRLRMSSAARARGEKPQTALQGSNWNARYRLEVSPTVFTLFEQLSDDSWFPLYAFPRDTTKNQPRFAKERLQKNKLNLFPIL